MTPREKQIYDVMTIEPMSAGALARAAGIRTQSPAETAARYAIALAKQGLAVRIGPRFYPKWHRA